MIKHRCQKYGDEGPIYAQLSLKRNGLIAITPNVRRLYEVMSDKHVGALQIIIKFYKKSKRK